MSAVVVDASIAVKWFFPEPHAHEARQVLEGRRTLLAPDLIWAEVANVLWKRLHRAEIASEVAEHILHDFKRFPLQTYAARVLLEPAWTLAARCRISVYDGLYLALALSRKCELVTADRALVDAVRRDKPLAPSVVWVEDIH